MSLKKQINFILLFVLIFPLLGLLWHGQDDLSFENINNCSEFAHIHRFLTFKSKQTTMYTHKSENCHEGKSLSVVVILSSVQLAIQKAVYPTYSLVLRLKNLTPEPYLKKRRKPPKFG